MYANNLTKLPASWTEEKKKTAPASATTTATTTATSNNNNNNGVVNGDHPNGLPPNSNTNGNASGNATNGNLNGSSSSSPKDSREHGAVSARFLEGKAVRTVYGPVPLALALDWPIFASYDELTGCAAWMAPGGRVPTFEEARAVYRHADRLRRRKEAENQLGKTVPAVNA